MYIYLNGNLYRGEFDLDKKVLILNTIFFKLKIIKAWIRQNGLFFIK